MYGLKRKSKIKKNWEIHTETSFVLLYWRYIFFCYFAFLQKFEYMYFFVKKAQPYKGTVQTYITIGERNKENKDIYFS